ncbi:MAG TPA: DUF456 domain-containing protein [Jiangellales bacterium]|nr:DUF456 domain-containing protein [Jiangellales bacterium]
MDTTATVLVGIAIAVGLVGIVVPVLPGLLLVWGAIAVWAVVESSAVGWALLAIATVLFALSQVVKYLVPGRRLRDAGVPSRAIVAGGVLGIIGFFVVPVVGLFVGFVGGVYLAELARLRRHDAAWPSTVHALKAAGLSILIELLTGLLLAVGWVGVVTFG